MRVRPGDGPHARIDQCPQRRSIDRQKRARAGEFKFEVGDLRARGREFRKFLESLDPNPFEDDGAPFGKRIREQLGPSNGDRATDFLERSPARATDHRMAEMVDSFSGDIGRAAVVGFDIHAD
jgi:hypothetical protein